MLANLWADVRFAARAVVTRALSSVLFGVSPLDPVALGGAAAFVLAVALVAGAIPARRAMRVDPTAALRAE
jgi:ABC-type antimicrobial peptide transport system permease subunit